MEALNEEAASGLGAKIVAKINEVISAIKNERKADAAWKADIEWRLREAEEKLKILQARNHGLKIIKGKAVAAQRRAEAKLEEARQLLN
jgi:hypothetical protein